MTRTRRTLFKPGHVELLHSLGVQGVTDRKPVTHFRVSLPSSSAGLLGIPTHHERTEASHPRSLRNRFHCGAKCCRPATVPARSRSTSAPLIQMNPSLL